VDSFIMKQNILVFSTFLGLLAAGCNRGPAAQGFKMPPPAVTVVAAVTRDVPLYLDEIGTCTARQYVTVMPQITGPVTKILFTDGQEIHQGDALFTIDKRPFQAALDQAQADLQRGKAMVDFSDIEWERMKGLLATKAVSQDDYDTKKNAAEVANAQYAGFAAAVETARLNLEYCTVKSPIDGRAGQRLVDVGNVVTAYQTGLLVIQTLEPIYADFTCAEGDLPSVRRYAADGSLRTLVKLPGDTDEGREGTLTFIDTQVQDQAGTVKLRATLPNADRHFWPGQFINARLILHVEKNAVLIPDRAQQLGQDGPFVYVVKNDSTAELRPVTLGQRQGDMVVVEKGIGVGDSVVVTGQLLVQPGGKVRVADAAPGAPVLTAQDNPPAAGPQTRPSGEKS
jgi:membrane fusion protein, multidrug efflux system